MSESVRRTMAKPTAKRKHFPKPPPRSSKKQRENGGDQSAISLSPFDLLCDNTLLRILSYTDDLRSLIHFTRCTSKSLRSRFDPSKKSEQGDSDQCSKLWQGVFADLLMSPLDEADKSLDYFDAIGYRISLHRRLIAHDKRSKAKGNAARRCYPLPLRHHYFKPLPGSWNLRVENDLQNALVDPISLLSGGTGEEFVMINPNTLSIEVHESIMDKAICLDKSTQRKRASDPTYDGPTTLGETRYMLDSVLFAEPKQMLLSTYSHSVDKSSPVYWHRTISSDWNYYFGKGTPFDSGEEGGLRSNNPQHQLAISSVVIGGCDLMRKGIFMARIIHDRGDQNNVCTELVFWGHRGRNEITPSSFELKNIVRLPGEWTEADICPDGNELYVMYEGDCSRIPGDAHPQTEDVKKTVFHFDLSSSTLGKKSSTYLHPECLFLAKNEIRTLLAAGRKYVLVGTKAGTIEIWDCKDKYAPSHIRTLHADETFEPDPDFPEYFPNTIARMYLVGHSTLQYGFTTVQEEDGHHGVISLWQTPTLNLNRKFNVGDADFQMMAQIEYECYPEVVCARKRLMVLGHDKFGSLFLDIFHILGSRFSSCDFDHINLPKDIDVTYPHPDGKNHIQFANRIKIHHRVEIRQFGLGLMGVPERVVVDANDRFVIITAAEGLVGADGGKKAGPGLIVIDLDEHDIA